MSMFSERYGYTEKTIQLESMTPELRNRIWNLYVAEIDLQYPQQITNYLEEIMDVFGLPCTGYNGSIDNDLVAFCKWFMKTEWYRIYDFIEAYLRFLPPEDRKKRAG